MPSIADAIRPAVLIIAQHGSRVSAAATGFGTWFGTAAEVALTLLDSANNATPLGTSPTQANWNFGGTAFVGPATVTIPDWAATASYTIRPEAASVVATLPFTVT